MTYTPTAVRNQIRLPSLPSDQRHIPRSARCNLPPCTLKVKDILYLVSSRLHAEDVYSNLGESSCPLLCRSCQQWVGAILYRTVDPLAKKSQEHPPPRGVQYILLSSRCSSSPYFKQQPNGNLRFEVMRNYASDTPPRHHHRIGVPARYLYPILA